MAATIDPSVKVRPSKSMLAFLEGLKDRDDVPKAIRNSNSHGELDVADVRWIFEKRSENGEGKRFHELLSECEVVLPSPVAITPPLKNDPSGVDGQSKRRIDQFYAA